MLKKKDRFACVCTRISLAASLCCPHTFFLASCDAFSLIRRPHQWLRCLQGGRNWFASAGSPTNLLPLAAWGGKE